MAGSGATSDPHPLILAEMLHDWALRRERGSGQLDRMGATEARRLAARALDLHAQREHAGSSREATEAWEFAWWKLGRRATRLLSMGTRHGLSSDRGSERPLSMPAEETETPRQNLDTEDRPSSR